MTDIFNNDAFEFELENENRIKIIVKVGPKSTLSFNNADVKRAITLEEMMSISERNNDYTVIIIERLKDNEIDTARDFLNNFRNNGKQVWFYVPDNDEITCGLADEMCLDIFMNSDMLFENIQNTLGEYVGTRLDKINGTSVEIEDTTEDNEITDEIEVEYTQVEEGTEVENEVENNIENIEDFSDDNEEIEEYTEESEEVTPEVSDNTPEVVSEASVELPSTSLDLEDDIDVVENIKEKVDISDEEVLELRSKIKTLIEEKNNLIEAVKLMKKHEEDDKKIVDSVKKEYDDIANRYEEIVNSDNVIEEPVSLQEMLNQKQRYEQLKEDFDSKESQISNLKSEIENLNTDIASKENEISELVKQIDQLREQITSTEQELAVTKEEMQTNVANSEEVEELKNQLEELTNEKQFDAKKIEDLADKVGTITESKEAESAERLLTLNFANSTIQRITELNEQLVNCKNELEAHKKAIQNLKSSDSSNINTIEEQEKEIIDLKSKLADVDKQIQDATSELKHQNSELTRQVDELKSKTIFQDEQLKIKEDQYSKLIQVSGIDAGGANALVETNRALEDINKTLREQIRITQQDLDKASKDKRDAQSSINSLVEKNKQLELKIKSMASSAISGSGEIRIAPINVSGNGFIIPVFGSGSYGTTTTAISIANKLAMNSKVAYIDMDLVNAKAEDWFKVSAICGKNIAGYSENMKQNFSSLGVFYNMGADKFIDNVYELCQVVYSKGAGELHYYSGVLSKTSSTKLIAADYSKLFSYLSSSYKYVIVDLGRFGSNEVNDGIIKAISDIAFKNVLVTTSDKIDVRNFRIKLAENKIRVEKCAWLLNFNQGMDDRIKKLVTPANYGVLPIHEDIIGSKETFDRAPKLIRDKFKHFMDNVVFGN